MFLHQHGRNLILDSLFEDYENKLKITFWFQPGCNYYSVGEVNENNTLDEKFILSSSDK